MTSIKLTPTRQVRWVHEGGWKEGVVVQTWLKGFIGSSDDPPVRPAYWSVVQSFGEFFVVDEADFRDVVPRSEWKSEDA